MSSPALTDDQITDFLGNIELHILTMKAEWQFYLQATANGDTVSAANAKAAALAAISVIQQILNTVESPLGLTLPNTMLSSDQIAQYGILPAPQAPDSVAKPTEKPVKKERTKWQKKHGLKQSS